MFQKHSSTTQRFPSWIKKIGIVTMFACPKLTSLRSLEIKNFEIFLKIYSAVHSGLYCQNYFCIDIPLIFPLIQCPKSLLAE